MSNVKRFRPKKILVYSDLPPSKCGIGKYAAEHILHLKSEGHRVYTCSFSPTAVANYRVDLYSPRSIVKAIILLLLSRFDAIHVHYTYDFFFPYMVAPKKRMMLFRGLQTLFFLALAVKSGKDGSVIFHEAYAGSSTHKLFLKLRAVAFSFFKSLVFHTEPERERMLEAFPTLLKRQRTEVVAHERFMQPKYFGTQKSARTDLGVPQDKTVFLCIGFIQDHKGFHVAAEALQAAGRSDALLYIVGSLRVQNRENIAYRHELLAKIAGMTNVHLVETFVTDEAFDKWIVASDAVVLPYREISSSGVGARAVLLHRDLVINGQTNLKTQFAGHAGIYPYSSEDELVRTFGAYKRQPDPPAVLPGAGAGAANRDSLLFVMPWFGPEVKGGAEKFIYDLCAGLARSGKAVEVWTTASSSIEGRNNRLLNDLNDAKASFKIRRFKTNVGSERFFQWAHRRMNGSGRAGSFIGWVWKNTALYGVGMREALLAEHDRFSTVHLCHYFGGSTHRLAGLLPHKTIVHPFIHDEPPLYRPVMRHLFSGVRGVICNSRAERGLGERSEAGLLGSCFKPIGNGVDALAEVDPSLPAERPRKKQLVFVGRLIADKNLYQLVEWLGKYNKTAEEQVDLHLIGEGPLANDPRICSKPFVHVSGWLGEAEKRHYLRDMLALVQPSLLESFSLVMVEAWAMKTPVISHSGCAATRIHVEDSGGGFAVGSAREFARALDALVYDQNLAALLGGAGFRYVMHNFQWDTILERFDSARSSLMGWGAAAREPGPPPEAKPVRIVTEAEFRGREQSLTALNGVIHRPPASPVEMKFTRYFGSEFYVRFEEYFRDTSAPVQVMPSWPLYLELARALAGDDVWVDIGAGRGLFLDYLSASGIDEDRLFGVEPDAASYAALYKKPYDTCAMGADAFLAAIPDDSLTVISMLHVVEHIPWPQLCWTVKLAQQKLRSGGRIVIEMPYVNTLKTGTTNFWLDPTHLRPVVGETLEFLLSTCGFVDIEKTKLAPHFSAEHLERLATEVGSTLLVEEVYGPQDVSYVGRKP